MQKCIIPYSVKMFQTKDINKKKKKKVTRLLVIRKLGDPSFSSPAIRRSGDPVIRLLVHAL